MDNRRQVLLSLVIASSAAWWALASPIAGAFVRDTNTCGGATWRPSGGHVVRQMCADPPGFPGFSNASDPVQTATAATQSVLSAHWMWVREGTSNATLSVDQSVCPSGSGFDWYDNANEKNDIWWESTATIRSIGGACDTANILGCTSRDHVDCWWFGVETTIIAADIVANFQAPWSVVRQDTISECLSPGVNSESLWMHEIGHAYGLGHESSRMAVMNSPLLEARNCHTHQGFHGYPFPDDIAGLMQKNKGFSGTKNNVAGTAWVRNNGVDGLQVATVSMTGTQTVTLNVIVTLHNYYASTFTGATFALVPTSLVPALNTTTKVWDMKAPVTTGFASGTFGVESRTISIAGPVRGADLPVGIYRVWVQTDPSRSVVETDEGDNVFPTNIFVVRS